jgi:hypothetical protein
MSAALFYITLINIKQKENFFLIIQQNYFFLFWLVKQC